MRTGRCQPEYQGRRRAEYHRPKISTDPEYGEEPKGKT
jgi:hypothetical protein